MKRIVPVILFTIFLLSAGHSVGKNTGAGETGESSQGSAVLQNVEKESLKQQKINRNREFKFKKNLVKQRKILKKLEDDLAHEERISEQLEEKFSQNESKLVEKNTIYEDRLGAFNELLGVVRQVAADTRVQFENSLISTHDSARLATLKNISEQQGLPTTEDLGKLWQLLLHEMQEQGKSQNYEAKVIDGNGLPVFQKVTRIGPFVAFNSEGKFLNYNSATLSFNQLTRQPRKDYQRAAKKYSELAGVEEGIVPVDPSRGAILSLLIQRPTIDERIQQGGVIAYIILILAAFGFLLAFARLGSLAITGKRLRQQLRNLDQPLSNNPLGEILAIAKSNRHLDIESLELMFDDIVLKAASRLRKGLSTLKVLAGMAPLLGLLGTVTGMIETFQMITLFGSGDARLMAGGISQALVTTALGLSAAIPILLLHSIASSRSRILVELLEEQVAGIVAEHAKNIGFKADNNRSDKEKV